MTQKTFGEYIRDARIQNKMTLRQASLATGLSAVRLSQIETHRAERVGLSELLLIREHYGFPDSEYPHLDWLYLKYQPDLAAIERNRMVLGALQRGASPAWMAERFGVLVCRASSEDVKDFRDLCEEEVQKPGRYHYGFGTRCDQCHEEIAFLPTTGHCLRCDHTNRHT